MFWVGLLALPATPKISCTFFLLKDCPIANRMAPELNRIVRAYSSRGIRFTIEFEDQDLPLAEATSHARAYGFSIPVKLDPAHREAKLWKISTSPTALVKSGATVLYRGRIDDSYAGVGKPRTVTTRHDLRDALEAILKGKAPAHQEVPAVGCRIL